MSYHLANSVDDLAYSFSHLDNLLEEAGIDVLMITSKHNVKYLLGGHQFIFFSAMDAIGHSRYLPYLLYFRGDIDKTGYVGNVMETGEHQNHPFWVPHFMPASWGSTDATETALNHLRAMGVASPRIGIERAFLPSDAHDMIAHAFPNSVLVDAGGVMETLRAIKSEKELTLLRQASDGISDAMQATMAATRAGHSKTEIIERLRREETNRGLTFDYCLLTLGSSHNRAAGPQTLAEGEIISMDSGGNLHGYIGDICRMGILGEPDHELSDLLNEIEAVQQAAFSKIRAGTTAGDVISHAQSVLAENSNRDCTDFFGHGMGLISHEAPFIMTNHPVRYDGTDADKPLKPGMVLSLETTMLHPKRGFVKLEDTVAVTDNGYEMFGTEGRGWNRAGTAAD
ncbi:Xaa-Pro peptidase family protein [Tropicibacter sp. Alg240-R139]|uniref:M24 family metallopeptidase n=1 Tax=Tropicibacter sp. Alg240-R139 TaxID=2305991 RepID=UPI0019682E39|nr:Xaa-Pro peptidase family protein [Tropicibacter sp. Alg240-R139]